MPAFIFQGYQGDALNSFQTSYEDLKQYYTTDGQRMVASARRLAQATALMIADIKAQAEESGDDSDRQNRLFHAAKQLADATTNLINAAKVSEKLFLHFQTNTVPLFCLEYYGSPSTRREKY